jgi:hypothetical protein
MEEKNWNQEATSILKAELVRQNIKYDELILRLKKLGVEENYKGIANKINRGSFTFVFFMQCMEAINKKIELK